MNKKISILAVFCIGLILGVNAETDKNVQASDKVSFILFTLIENILRMEQYNLSEVKNPQTITKKDVRDKHLVFSIDFTEKGITPRDIHWDDENPGQLHISVGKKSKSKNYTLGLESIFKDTQEEDVIAVCFDCNIKNKKVESSWKADIDIILPIKIDSADMKLMFDSKVKAACGFFIEHDEFCNLIKIKGELTKQEALKNNVITEIRNGFSFKIVTEKIKNGAIYLKNKTIYALLALKHMIEGSYNTCVGLIHKK